MKKFTFQLEVIMGGGTENPMVRADMIYYKTPNDGALFAPGSLSWCGSLSYNNYNNNVSKILENAIRGFLKEGPLAIMNKPEFTRPDRHRW